MLEKKRKRLYLHVTRFSIAAPLSHPILHYCPRLGAEPPQVHSIAQQYRSASVRRVKTTRGMRAGDDNATPDEEVIGRDLETNRAHLLPGAAVGMDRARFVRRVVVRRGRVVG